MTEQERHESSVSRRTMLKRIGAAGAVAWVAPVISSLNTPAFAASLATHPECERATCDNFLPCSSANPDCVCVSSDQGGFCVPGSTPCPDITCNTSADCASGSFCATGTCCGVGVCLPLALTGQCPSGAAPHASTRP